MKITILLLFLAFGIWYFHPKSKPAQVVLKTLPIAPNLREIHISNGPIIRNAQIKEITDDGIIFICDRGLVGVSFGDLPIEFKNYYSQKK